MQISTSIEQEFAILFTLSFNLERLALKTFRLGITSELFVLILNKHKHFLQFSRHHIPLCRTGQKNSNLLAMTTYHTKSIPPRCTQTKYCKTYQYPGSITITFLVKKCIASIVIKIYKYQCRPV